MYQYPGPRIARFSKFWAMWVSSTGRQHAIYKELHEKYGTFVRTGECHVDMERVVNNENETRSQRVIHI